MMQRVIPLFLLSTLLSLVLVTVGVLQLSPEDRYAGEFSASIQSVTTTIAVSLCGGICFCMICEEASHGNLFRFLLYVVMALPALVILPTVTCPEQYAAVWALALHSESVLRALILSILPCKLFSMHNKSATLAHFLVVAACEVLDAFSAATPALSSLLQQHDALRHLRRLSVFICTANSFVTLWRITFPKWLQLRLDAEAVRSSGSPPTDPSASPLTSAVTALQDVSLVRYVQLDEVEFRAWVMLVDYSVTCMVQLYGNTVPMHQRSALDFSLDAFSNVLIVIAIIYNRNVTNRHQADAVCSNLAARRHLIKHVSHEMRTPLNVISIGLDLLLNNSDASANNTSSSSSSSSSNSSSGSGSGSEEGTEQHDQGSLELIHELHNSCQRATEIIDDLVSFEDTESMSRLNGDTAPQRAFEFVRAVAEGTDEGEFAREHRVTVTLSEDSEAEPVLVCAPSAKSPGSVKAPFIDINRTKLSKALQNILHNAVKYSGTDGRVTMSVGMAAGSPVTASTSAGVLEALLGIEPSAHSSNPTGSLRIAIADAGCGLSAAAVATLAAMLRDKTNTAKVPSDFNPMNNRQDGAKAGLVAARNIINNMGGSVTITSAGEGRGCTVFVTLPAMWLAVPTDTDSAGDAGAGAAAEEGGAEAASETAGPEANAVGAEPDTAPLMGQDQVQDRDRDQGQNQDHDQVDGPVDVQQPEPQPEQDHTQFSFELPWNVLVVDDVPLNRRMVGRLLRNRNHSVIEADDGDTCVQIMTGPGGAAIDVVLLDNTMPRMKGRDAVRIMRENGITVPVIGITGDGLADLVHDFREQGADVVLSKPVNYSVVQSAIEQSVRAGRMWKHFV